MTTEQAVAFVNALCDLGAADFGPPPYPRIEVYGFQTTSGRHIPVHPTGRCFTCRQYVSADEEQTFRFEKEVARLLCASCSRSGTPLERTESQI